MRITRNRPSVTLPSCKYDADGLPTRFFNPGELDTLLQLFESVDARVIVEFGCHEGRNAAAALRNLPAVERYIGVDVAPGYVTTMAVQRNEVPAQPGRLAAHDPRFELIVKPRGTFDLVTDDLPQADAVFIDADHSRKGVEHDTMLALAIVKPRGGIVIWHDDNCLPVVEVTQTLNDFCGNGMRIEHVAGTWLAFMRV